MTKTAGKKQGENWEDAKLGGQLHKAFMAEIGEEMCQAEVAHDANRIPEFFISRRVKHVHLYKKLLALTYKKKPCEEEAEYDGGGEWAWEESAGARPHRASDIELYCLLYTSPSPRDRTRSRMPSSA